MSPRHDDDRIEELELLVRKPVAEFTERLERRLDRRLLARDLSVMSWKLPKLLIGETLFVCAAWLKSKRRPGGSS